MSNTPFCNVSIATPGATPQAPLGLQSIAQGATLKQVINTVNNNFQKLMKGNFQENRAARQTVITRIFDPNDPSAFIDVAQVVGVQWVNSTTGQLISWKQ